MLKKPLLHFHLLASLISILVILSMALVYSHMVFVETKEQLLTSLYENARQQKQLLTKEMNSNQELVLRLAALIGSAGLLEEPELSSYLQAVKDHSSLKGLGVIFPEGNGYTVDQRELYLGDRGYFRTSLQGQSAVSETLRDKTDGEKINVCSAPIRERGEITAVLFAVYPTEHYQKLLTDLTVYDPGFSAIVAADGDLIASSRDSENRDGFFNIIYMLRQLDTENSSAADRLSREMAAGRTGHLLYRQEGEDFLLHYQPLDFNQWYLLTAVPEKAASTEGQRLLFSTYLFAFACVAVVLLLVYTLWKLRSDSCRSLERIAYVDSLTGGYTFVKFQQEALSLLARHPRTTYAAAYLDIDQFSYINELFGRSEGDRILCFLHDLLKERLTKEECFCRLNADSFALLLQADNPQELQKRLDELCQSFQKGCAAGQRQIAATLSIGVYLLKENRSVALSQILDWANLPHKEAKKSGLAHIIFYDDALRQKNLRAKEIEARFGEALTAGEFVVYYQAEYNIRRKSFHGAEALVRWQDPVKGLISPDQFIPALEKNGSIVSLDEYVFRCVCRQIRQWLDLGYEVYPISVNISRLHVYQGNFVEKYAAVVREYGIPFSLIQLEFTETLMLSQDDILSEVIRRLQALGFRILLDDFGSGYSSLTMLNHLSIDVLKLDKTLIQDSDSRPNTRKILRSLIRLAQELGIEVVAEGVETQEQFAFLAQAGCDYIQGYYYARPEPAAEYVKLLKKR